VEAQIISVADFIDALATNRAYRPKFPYEKVESMLKEKGEKGHFNTQLVEAGIEMIRSPEFRKLYSEKGTYFKPDTLTGEQAALEYYLEPFEEFTSGIREFCEYLRDQKKELPLTKLSSALSAIRRLGIGLAQLAEQVGKTSQTISKVNRKKQRAKLSAADCHYGQP